MYQFRMNKNSKILGKFSTPLLAAIIFLGCSNSRPINDEEKRWLASGQITISRSAPEAASVGSMSMLGFLPVIGTHTGLWLSIDSKSKKVSLMEGSRIISTSEVDGMASGITPGSYQVLHMQKSALWYATDEYFTKRGLEVPSQGDKARFRRGAFGEYAIFLNKDTPIHSGPMFVDEIGGIRLSESDMSKIYYQLQVGSIIEVK